MSSITEISLPLNVPYQNDFPQAVYKFDFQNWFSACYVDYQT